MKTFLLSVFLVFSGTWVNAQNDSSFSSIATSDSSATIDSAAMATVYVIRSTGYVASAVNLRVAVDEEMRCKIKNNRYAIFMVQPGTHVFTATSWDKAANPEKFGLKMPVEAGKSYYLSMRVKQKFIGIEIFMEEITQNSAAPLLSKYKLDDCD